MQVEISSIEVGDRRRKDYGDITGLAESIDKYGLLHPVVIDDTGKLVAGGRRLMACLKLGWKKIDVRKLGELTPLELREIELEKNRQRKDLTPSERTKLMVEQAEASEAIVKEQRKQAKSNSGHKVSQNGRGRPKADNSEKEAAERMGVPRATVRKAKQHKTAFDRYPFLDRPHWNQSNAIEAFTQIEDMPAADRPRAVAMVDGPAIPPANALTMLGTLAAMTPKNRRLVFADFESGDAKRKSQSISCAAAMPPNFDGRIGRNVLILKEIGKAQSIGDEPEYKAAIEAINQLQERLQDEYQRDAKSLERRRNGR